MAKQPKKTRGGGKQVGQEVVLPKSVPNKVTSASPATGVTKGQELRRSVKDTVVNSVSDVRGEPTIIGGLRLLAKDDGMTSSAIFMAASIANSPIKLTAYTTNTREFDPEATRALESIRASMDTLHDYSKGFNHRPTIRGFIAQSLAEALVTSGICAELVLTEERLPDYIAAADYSSLKYKSRGDGTYYPVQKVKGGADIELDVPNFFISEINRPPGQAYSDPLLRAALNSTITNAEFIEDMRRVVDRTGHSRLVVTLNAVMVSQMAPETIQDDPKKLLAYLEEYQTSMSTVLKGLSPEDSVVVYDNVEVDVKDIGGTKSDYVPLMKTLNNMQATALKTPSSILGLRSEGSQSLSNVESLTYLKMLGALQGPIADVLSRAFTLAVRLHGFEAYAEIKFEPINLRPEDELEAYRTMRNDRYLKNLSLGIWTQEQYCHEAGYPYRPDMPDLSGTMFHEGMKAAGGGTTDNTGGAEQQLNPGTPKKGGGSSQ